MFDLDLLQSFVSVVDAGGFTRAGERVNRTQSTVSQQIRRLEDGLGRPLFHRDRRRIALTEAGETLLGYARRLLALAGEARQALVGQPAPAVVRLGIPEDFAVTALTGVIASFAAARPDIRLEVRCDLSVALRDGLTRGLYDLVLAKREPGQGPAFGAWPERLVWAAGAGHAPAGGGDPLPLVTFLSGCLYRERAIRALEAAGRRWRIAYESPNLAGVQAAVAGGLGIALLEAGTVGPGLQALGPAQGLPPIPPTELALMRRPDAPEGAIDLCGTISDFCSRKATENRIDAR
ncbi:LysR substrate-binding domain-containing protein [Zavarzinia compransoris]|uniref:LysR family transcriptional regulator n=1 Tax=Zavarzinia compransoris TaxID=1264899 RepID=A0A317E1T2_9PROT|nr:LysR substrate-binding domain-containing protein [Zavarzinia compransoris]PWR20100.1 LysR family transcriptional regulator [Zavarzinia compransoris]TDP43344.1 DNA-binding transcriptional LysR family regulator [Zavarzinia compransoris]